MSKKKKCCDNDNSEFETITSQSLARWNSEQATISTVATQNFVASQNAAQQQMLLALFPKSQLPQT